MGSNDRTKKAPGFYNKFHLHICSICLRLDVSSLKEIQWLQIELNEKGTIPMKVWWLECFICTNTSDEQSEFDWL